MRDLGGFLLTTLRDRLNAAGTGRAGRLHFSTGFVEGHDAITGILQVSFPKSVEFLRNPSPRRQSGAKLFRLPPFFRSGARTFRKREIECLKSLQSSLHSRLPQAFLAACRLTHLLLVLPPAPHSAERPLSSLAEAARTLPQLPLPVASSALRSQSSKPTSFAGHLSRTMISISNAVCPDVAGGVFCAGFASFPNATRRTRHV